LSELIDRSIFTGGWEPETIAFLRREIRSGDVAIEVGANVGAHTLIIAQAVGSTGKVYAFEATSSAVAKLQRNIELNPILAPRIDVQTRFVTNHEEDDPQRAIRSSWKVNQPSEPWELVKAESISLDAFAAKTGLARLDLLKIDVDGYDYKVLAGATGIIKKFRPTLFVELCERALNAQGDSVGHVLSLLSELGYSAFYESGAPIKNANDVTKRIGLDSSLNAIFRCCH
jgi:FkbM family methyltransferase